MWSYVTPPGPEDNAAGPSTSTRALLLVFLALLLLALSVFLVPLLFNQYQEWTNSEDVQIRDRWIAETSDMVEVTDAWTGRDRVSIGFDSCDREASFRVGFDETDRPAFLASGRQGDMEWRVLDEEAVRGFEASNCRETSEN